MTIAIIYTQFSVSNEPISPTIKDLDQVENHEILGSTESKWSSRISQQERRWVTFWMPRTKLKDRNRPLSCPTIKEKICNLNS